MNCKKCGIKLNLPEHMWEDDYWLYCPECGRRHKNPYKGIHVDIFKRIVTKNE